jgi:DedD protein
VTSKPAPEVVPAPASVPAKAAPQQLADKLEMDVNNLPVAWVVQAGAMATQAAADKLKQDLIAKGFKAFTQPSKLANGSATIKVFVGPKLSRERADAQKKQIDAALKTNTMVVRFPPA